MQLLNKLKNKPLSNELHFILFAVIIFLLALKYWFFYILLIIYLIFLFRKTKLIIISIMLLAFLFGYITIINNIKIKDEEIKVRIDDINTDSYIALYKGLKIKIYDTNKTYKPGDIVNYKLSYYEDELKSYDTEFDYFEYLKSNRIIARAKAISSNKISSGFSIKLIKYYIKNYLENKIDSESYSYIKAIVLSENDISKDLKSSYSSLGLSHIFAISGMHIILIYTILSFIMLKLFKYYKSFIPILIITIYVFIIGMPISATRALLMIIITNLNEKGKIKYTKLDIFSISFIIMVIFWPLVFYNAGFILSYLVSFVLLFKDEIIKFKSKLINTYLTFYLIYFVTLPIIINFNNTINIFTLLFSPILSVLIAYIIIPISFIEAILPITNYLFKYVFSFIGMIVSNLDNLSIKINIMSLNVYFKVIYWFILVLLIIGLIKRKDIILKSLVFIFYLFILINFKTINPLTKITFIDVGQGDSCLIELGNNRGNMLIDAYNCFDYIKSTGIKNIDYLILTHSDNDHIEDAFNIINYFNVKNIYVPLYDTGFKDYKCKYIKSGYSFYLDDVLFEVMGPINKYEEKNSNSIVLKCIISNTSFLFTGDMTVDEENDLVNKYKNKLDIDILKVGHHGSNTSSSNLFLSYVTPKVSIISVKNNNIYGLPDKIVLDRLNKISNVYMTKDHGNITFYLFNNRYFIHNYR